MQGKTTRISKKSYITPRISDFNEISDMLESGMEDYEIASELGMAKDEVSKLQREIYND